MHVIFKAHVHFLKFILGKKIKGKHKSTPTAMFIIALFIIVGNRK